MGNLACCNYKPSTIETPDPLPEPPPKIEPQPSPEPPKSNNTKRQSKKKKAKTKAKTPEPKKTRKTPKFSRQDFIVLKQQPLEDNYTLLDFLGKGSFGSVYKAKHKLSDTFRAVKILKKESLNESTRKKLLEEVEILKSLDHPNILKIFEVFEDENSVNIITELCTGGELFDRIVQKKCFSELNAAQYLYQIISAVIACHDKGIVHRDLKPENIIFIDQSEEAALKIIDFGMSVKKLALPLTSLTGTAYYMAPEVITGNYDEKCDVWSCGVILYIMLCGYPPFKGNTNKVILSNISRGYFSFTGKEWLTVSAEAKSLIMKMLTRSPLRRPSALEIFSESWIQNRFHYKLNNNVLASRTLKNLSHFKASRELQKFVLEFVTNQMVSSEETQKLREAFLALDKNGDGKLSIDELKTAFRCVGLGDKDVDEVILVCDGDGNGFIDYSEFLTATLNWRKVLSHERLLAVFKVMDKDSNGFISLEEIKEFFGEVGKEIEDGVWKEMISEADLDGDGFVDFKEFVRLMVR